MPPHIIYILSDEHRGQAMGHMGDPNVRTPTMDRLAAEGVSFARAYANCPLCTPSRGTIFSGRHAHAGPVQSFWDVYKPTAPSTATLLRDAGYRSAYFGKWHCGIVRDQQPPEVRANPENYPPGFGMRTPENHRGGFQDWFAFEDTTDYYKTAPYRDADVNPTRLEGYHTDVLTDAAIDYIENYERDDPLFMVLSVVPPHFPMDVPDQWVRLQPDEVELRPNVTFDSPIPHTRARQHDLRERLCRYYGMIENLDWNIGRLQQALASRANFDNTALVYFSDHGEFMGSHGRIERKEHPHEESVRIPSIFHHPGTIPATGLTDALFSLVDMMPTTLGLAGVGIPVHNQGVDFSPLLRGDSFSPPPDVLLEMHGSPRWILDEPDWRGLVTSDWKYAYYDTGDELLFNLADDPYEQSNLAATHPENRAELRQLLLTRLRETRDPYFDVLIEHGVQPEGPVTDVSVM